MGACFHVWKEIREQEMCWGAIGFSKLTATRCPQAGRLGSAVSLLGSRWEESCVCGGAASLSAPKEFCLSMPLWFIHHLETGKITPFLLSWERQVLGVNLRSALSLWSRTSQQGLQWEKAEGWTCVCSSKQEVNRGLISWLWHYIVSKLVLKAYCVQRHIIGISRYQTDLFSLSACISMTVFFAICWCNEILSASTPRA